MSTKIPDLLSQEGLDVKTIADVQLLLNNKSAQLELVNKFEYKGILLLEVDVIGEDETAGPNRRKKAKTTVRHRVLVLREDLKQDGCVVMMRLSEKNKATTTHGLDLRVAGGIGETHWCSGLAIKQFVTENTRGVTTAKRKLHDARENLCKSLLDKIKNDTEWNKQKWKDIKAEINEIQPFLIAKSKSNKPSSKLLAKAKAPTSRSGTTGIKKPSDKTGKQFGQVDEPKEEPSVSPVQSDTSYCDFEMNKFNNLSAEEVAKAQILYSAISRSQSTCKIPEDLGFGNLMAKAYPMAPFPVESLPGWRADKSTTFPVESDWFRDWWNSASQRPSVARKSNKIGSTGMTQAEIDGKFQHLILPLITLFVVKINWEGKIPPQYTIPPTQVQDLEMEDASEDSLSDIDLGI